MDQQAAAANGVAEAGDPGDHIQQRDGLGVAARAPWAGKVTTNERAALAPRAGCFFLTALCMPQGKSRALTDNDRSRQAFT
jgi:hypothetical protein